MHVIVVKFTVRPERLDAFLPLMRENARRSLEEEPGCHQFDVAQHAERRNEIFLYELYDDAAAFDQHLHMPHFRAFDEQTQEMILDKQVTAYQRLNPAKG